MKNKLCLMLTTSLLLSLIPIFPEAWSQPQIPESSKVSQIVSNLFLATQKKDFRKRPEVLKILKEEQGSYPVYLALRKEGHKKNSQWFQEKGWILNLVNALEWMKTQNVEPDMAELVIAYDHQPVLPMEMDKELSNVARGVMGIRFRFDKKWISISPTKTISSNRSFQKEIDKYRKDKNINPTQAIEIEKFKAYQFLIPVQNPQGIKEMYRGNQLVKLQDVSKANVHDFMENLGGWLVRNVDPDGRMVYKYWPSLGKESSANNMIRQWMASVALTRYGKQQESTEILELAKKNITYNIKNFYHEENGFGLIEYKNKVKLGALSLAALAMFEYPERDRFKDYESALRKLTESMQHDDGDFETFYKGGVSGSNQNYYPGETLLYWSFVYEESQSEELLNKLMKSFRYYRKWHLEPNNRNPAFIPWQTQAYYKIWKLTKNKELQDFIFEMNDWLLPMQQWDNKINGYDDVRGRFYNPDARQFGPPHASSTGVYLEGLIDAYKLAKEIGDTKRSALYRLAILRGLRSSMQLQFRDEVDMFYVSKRDQVQGGMRTTVYDNSIRVDNVQHVLMAVLKIYREFEEKDYQVDDHA